MYILLPILVALTLALDLTRTTRLPAEVDFAVTASALNSGEVALL
ncbi:hypothetical protein V5F89_03975 [Pelagerythrobacter marensis]|uniref:Uncharacterized protein n=1 Tax=Pelagerythrobacter marensis TaxID=543877 RepID=A0ABZ2DB87_9SPHN